MEETNDSGKYTKKDESYLLINIIDILIESITNTLYTYNFYACMFHVEKSFVCVTVQFWKYILSGIDSLYFIKENYSFMNACVNIFSELYITGCITQDR